MNRQIPAPYYKRAAEIMSDLPDVDFMNIVAVLYAHNTWCARKSADLMEKFESESEPFSEKESEPAEKPDESAPKPSLDPQYIPTEKQKEKNGRKHPVRAKIDGKMFIAPSRRELCKQIGLDSVYDKIFHGGQRNQTIFDEADRLAEQIYGKFRSNLEEYYTYGFDGKFYCAFVKDNICERVEEVKA